VQTCDKVTGKKSSGLLYKFDVFQLPSPKAICPSVLLLIFEVMKSQPPGYLYEIGLLHILHCESAKHQRSMTCHIFLTITVIHEFLCPEF